MTYVWECKLGVAQIWCLSEHALFKLKLNVRQTSSTKLQTPLSSLSYHPQTYSAEDSSDVKSDEYKIISYATVYEGTTDIVNRKKVPIEWKQGISNVSINKKSIPATSEMII